MTESNPRTSGNSPGDQFSQSLVELIPYLRAFARSLCGDRERADDLAQEALVKAWKKQAQFEPGTNLKAWLFMILRNQFYSEGRRAWRQTELSEEQEATMLVSPAEQEGKLDLLDLRRAMLQLPAEQREALTLVGAGGFSYEEAARICECAVGTVKSRVARARRQLVLLIRDETLPEGRINEAAEDALGSLVKDIENYSRPGR